MSPLSFVFKLWDIGSVEFLNENQKRQSSNQS